jgi:hypothetical protein
MKDISLCVNSNLMASQEKAGALNATNEDTALIFLSIKNSFVF